MNPQRIRTTLTVASALAFAPWLAAQADTGASKEFLPHLQIWSDVGLGKLDHDISGTNLDGDDTATMLEIGVEGFSDSGFGGGVRLGLLSSEAGMFEDAGVDDVMATAVDVYLHVTKRWAHDRLAMPLRFGLLVNSYQLEEEETSATEFTSQFESYGIRTEFEPEYLLSDWDGVVLTAGTRLSLGSGWTECSNDPSTFETDSTTLFYGIDLGFRLRTGMGSFHLGWVLRGQSMDDIDVPGRFLDNGYDATFTGLLIGGGIFF